MEPKRYHHGDLKRALLKVAEKELAVSGEQSLSLRGIAKKAGVSHTAPYKHFRDKDQLLKEMVVLEYKKWVLFAEEIEWRYPDNQDMQFVSFAEKVLGLAEASPRKLNLMLASRFDLDFEREITSFHDAIKENLLRLLKDSDRIELFWRSLVGTALLFSHARMKEGESAESLAGSLAKGIGLC